MHKRLFISTAILLFVVGRHSSIGAELSYGLFVKDSITMNGEINTYQFNGNAGDVVTIRMADINSTPPTVNDSISPTIELHAPDGKILGTATGTQSARIDTVTLPANGVYTILAKDDDANQTGLYGITLFRAAKTSLTARH
jgi:hypothetical protein